MNCCWESEGCVWQNESPPLVQLGLGRVEHGGDARTMSSYNIKLSSSLPSSLPTSLLHSKWQDSVCTYDVFS